MLTRSVFITTKGLHPTSLSHGSLIQELFETMVLIQIQKTVTDRAYEHLCVAYNYQVHRPDMTSSDVWNIQFTETEEQEVRSVHNLIGASIQNLIEEFHLYSKNNSELVLNFNSCLLNRTTFVLSTEVLPS